MPELDLLYLVLASESNDQYTESILYALPFLVGQHESSVPPMEIN